MDNKIIIVQGDDYPLAIEVYDSDNAFNSCKGITSVVIPTGVVYVGTSAFSSCSNLKSFALVMGLKLLEIVYFLSALICKVYIYQIRLPQFRQTRLITVIVCGSTTFHNLPRYLLWQT